MNILECKNLSKAYKKNHYVLKDLYLGIPEGRILGLLGPNGCGKTTLIKLIAGLLQPNSGEILVNGQPISEESCALISYLPERPYFSTRMKVCELADYFQDFYADFDKERAYQLFEDLKIDPNANLHTLSKGTKEKVQLILVMSRRAKLYILDEPIAGVDPAAREYILHTIVNNYNPGASVLITTHLISDIEDILDDFIFLSFGGQVIRAGNAKQTRQETGKSLNDLFKETYINRG